MPSSYTQNLGIEKPGNGEQSGTWGDTVNDNSDIIDRASNGGVSLTLTGTSSTLTTSDGTLSDGQYKLLRLQGAPSGTHTITIDPNDSQKIYFVYNTCGQSVVFTQGSGGNVTVANGDSAVIYANGAGAGAAVLDVTANLGMSSVNITGGTITGITDLAVADGGTGASTASAARTNLGVAIGSNVQAWDANLDQVAALSPTDGAFIVGDGTSWTAETGVTARASLGLGTMATQNSSAIAVTGGTMSGVAITGGSVSGITDLAVADGGTGASTAADARTNLGLGGMATQNPGSVNITGGTIAGITDLAVADGGTGASTASGARTNLGLVIGTDVLAYDANLQSFVNVFTLPTVDGSNNYYLKTDGAGNLSFSPVSGASGGTVTSVDASGGTTGLTFSGGPITGSGTLTMAGTLAIANGGTGATTASAARTALSVPSTTGSGASGTWGISVTGSAGSLSSTLAIANGGTGATTAAAAQTALGVPSVTGSGASGTWGISITGNAATATTATSASSATTATTATNVSGTVAIANGGTGATTDSAARTNLGLAIGSNVQAYSAQLTTLAGLTPSDTGFIVGNGTAFTVETSATALLSLGINASAAELNKMDGVVVSTSQINSLLGVTGLVQTQLDDKAPIASPTFTGVATAPDFVATAGSFGVTAGADSALSPGFTWSGDSDTGMFRVGANALGFSTFGTERLRIVSGGAWGLGGATYGSSGQVIVSNGSGSAPTWGYPTQLSTASGSAPSYGARAWVNFNGTGTVAIRGSGNVSSITDNGTGDYTVNFTTAMPNANYAAVVTSGSTSNRSTTIASTTTTAVRINVTQSAAGGAADQDIVAVVVFA